MMPPSSGSQAVEDRRPSGYLPALMLLFVGSGCAALIYEIVWFQLLQLVIGSSAISLGVLLGTFMGGMCLGSLCLPRLVSERRHPLRVYAWLELAIGVWGCGVLIVLPALAELYTSHAGTGITGIAVRAAVCAAGLLPPTALMGATLPAVARWVRTTPAGIGWLGWFYGGNLAGAVFGCLLAGFYLLRIHDVAVATYAAVGINASVAIVALLLARWAPYRPEAADPSTLGDLPRTRNWPVYLAIGLSGMSALGAEVIWTRLLSLMLGATVYTFSLILAVFLVGLGIGSTVGSTIVRGTRHPRVALGSCQLLLCGAIAWAAYSLCCSLPYWPIDVSLSASPWNSFQLDLMRCVWAVLPAACLWGASFPLALGAAAARGQDPGRLAGAVYAANTIGAIVGALVFSMLAIPGLGTQVAQRWLIASSATAALLMLLPRAWRARETQPGNTAQPQTATPPGTRAARWATATRAAISSLGLLAVAAACAWTVPHVPFGLVAFGRYLPTYTEMPEPLYLGEGMNASIAVSERIDGVRNFHVSGKVVASSELYDMRLQRMLCHIPALIHRDPKTVLVVGCGAGVTAGSFVVHPSVERIVICEIEPLIPPAAAEHFSAENLHVMDDPRVEIVHDDARHFIATTDEKFDIITSDPIHPWVKGAAALYSQEYFELCKRRLTSDGIATQWVPLYETNLSAVKSQIATFLQVFPHGSIWSNDIEGEGYDVVLLGHPEPIRIDVDALQQRLEREDHRLVLSTLKELDLGSALGLSATYAGRSADLDHWLVDAEINRDRNLRLQYLAGMGLNIDDSKFIFDTLIAQRRYPDELFLATGFQERALRAILEGPRRTID
jgi:spermidine synthase